MSRSINLLRRIATYCVYFGSLFTLANDALAQNPSRLELEAMAETAAKRHGVPVALFKALVETESNWKINALGVTGSVGLAQIQPTTAKNFCGLSAKQLWKPELNLDCGARYIANLTKRFGSLKLAVCGYNAGESRVARLRQCPKFAITRRYTNKIMLAYHTSLSRDAKRFNRQTQEAQTALLNWLSQAKAHLLVKRAYLSHSAALNLKPIYAFSTPSTKHTTRLSGHFPHLLPVCRENAKYKSGYCR